MYDFLDTSVVVRYLTADPPDLADRARSLIETDHPLLITEAVVAEIAFVMKSGYGIGREAIVDLLIALIQRRNIHTHRMDKDHVIRALLLCRPSGRVSIVDALIWAAARSSGDSIVYTFDRRFPSEGIELREPGDGRDARSGPSQENGEST